MEHLQQTRADIRSIYLADERPWVIGFSGGKDSTAVTRLVFEALREIPVEQRRKPVFVVSLDTLVETPLVVSLIREALDKMRQAALDALVAEARIATHQRRPALAQFVQQPPQRALAWLSGALPLPNDSGKLETSARTRLLSARNSAKKTS